MANVLSGNPLVCDSTGELTTDVVKVQAIVWTGTEATDKDIAANDDFALAEANLAIIAEKRASAAGDDFAITFPSPIKFAGLNVTKLDGGICYVYKV